MAKDVINKINENISSATEKEQVQLLQMRSLSSNRIITGQQRTTTLPSWNSIKNDVEWSRDYAQPIYCILAADNETPFAGLKATATGWEIRTRMEDESF